MNSINVETCHNDINNNNNPIYTLKANSFSTHLKNFTQISSNIQDSIRFKTLFPTLFNYITDFDNNLIEKLFKSNRALNIDVKNATNEELILLDTHIKYIIEFDIKQIEEEFSTIILEEWNGLNIHYNGRTKIHIFLTLIFLFNDIEHILSNTLSEYEQNILYWALLLHDIAKHVILNQMLGESFNLKE